MTRRRWRDLSRRQQGAVVAAAVVQEALAAATLWDLRRRPSGQIRGGKKLWVAAASGLGFRSVRLDPGSAACPRVKLADAPG